MFFEAMAKAKKQDLYFKSNGKLIGPLHGIPVSMKDTVSFEGKDSTIGVIKLAFSPKDEHSPIIKQLMDAGAVPFVKTNVPQTMMTFECRNPLWGRTEHPEKPGFSPGGSTGGEAVLLALNASVIGIGNDVGGSLRIPAHFSGICSIKPSFNRISFAGSTGYYPSSLSIHPVNGPMARNVDDLILASSVMMCPNAHDRHTIHRSFDWSVVKSTKKLRIGIAFTDGFVTPVPAIHRALEETRAALEAAGHEVVDFSYPKNIVDLIGLFYSLISADGGHHFVELLRGEPIDPTLRSFFLAMQMHPQLHRVMSKTLPRFTSDQRLIKIVDSLGVKMTHEIIQLEGERQTQMRLFDEHWDAAGIDVLICPPNAMPATKFDTFTELNFTACYTVLWNLFDYVAGVMPVTCVDPTKDACPDDYPVPSGSMFKNDVLESMLYKHYNVDEMAGLPVGIQVVGKPYHEENVLNAMRVIQEVLQAA